MKFTFVGCSGTVGVGLALEKDDPNNYANIVTAHYSAKSTNLSESGNDNYNIFMSALNELLVNSPDKIIVQWTGLNRFWLYPSPNSVLKFCSNVNFDYMHRNVSYTKKQLQEFANMYFILNSDYKSIFTLINYCDILTKISKGRVIFINGLLPWTAEIFDKESVTDLAKKLSNYTKEILDFHNNNDDTELCNLFLRLNNAMETLDKRLWVNLFDSMGKIQFDYGNDDEHPGIKSHRLYADMIIKYLEENNG